MNTDNPDHSACDVVNAGYTPGDKQESFPNFTVLLDSAMQYINIMVLTVYWTTKKSMCDRPNNYSISGESMWCSL